MKKTEHQERREHRRFPFRKPFLIQRDYDLREYSDAAEAIIDKRTSPELLEAFSRDISVGGLLLEVNTKVEVNSMMKVYLLPPDQSDEVCLIGRVVWATGNKVGLHFEHLTPARKALLYILLYELKREAIFNQREQQRVVECVSIQDNYAPGELSAEFDEDGVLRFVDGNEELAQHVYKILAK